MIPIHFAPLQGYTEDVYRRLHYQLYGGVQTYYTPFVRYEHGEVRSKDLRDIKPEHNSYIPVVPQIIAKDGKEASALLEVLLPLGYKQIDVNMGCPFPLQTRHGRGAGILINPEKVQEIQQVLGQHADISFSVKMRLGLENSNDWQQILPILNDMPLKHITIHPRIAAQQYKGTVDMVAFEQVLQSCKHPVIFNGDVRRLQDIQELEQQYPTLAGIMIGRGLLARPSLAKEYTDGIKWTQRQQWFKLLELHEGMLEHYTRIIPGEAQLHQKLKTFWDYFEPQDDDSLLDRKHWKKIVKAGNLKNYLAAIKG